MLSILVSQLVCEHDEIVNVDQGTQMTQMTQMT